LFHISSFLLFLVPFNYWNTSEFSFFRCCSWKVEEEL
jgi:hypothetical protein